MSAFHPWWLSWGVQCDRTELSLQGAIKFARYVELSAQGIATTMEIRRVESGDEAIAIEVETNRPQRPAIALKAREIIAFIFSRDPHRQPTIFPLRPDFPESPHQNLTPDEWPVSLCLDDRPWSDSRLTWSSAELFFRLTTWLAKAGMGELHENGQPLDPVFVMSSYEIVLPRKALDATSSELNLIGYLPPESETTIVFDDQIPQQAAIANANPFCILAYHLPPKPMQKMRHLPASLSGLFREMERQGFDLIGDLTKRAVAWAGVGHQDIACLNSRLVVVLSTTVVSGDPKLPNRTDYVGFLIKGTVGAIGVALGRLLKGNFNDYLVRIQAGKADENALAKIDVIPARVHHQFDGARAAELSGAANQDRRKVVIVGAGAIGSIVSEILVREGRFTWTVIDNDTFFPHNTARHTLASREIGARKAKSVASRLLDIRADSNAKAITADFLRCENEPEIQVAITAADIVIDASASIAVARQLGDLPATGRRFSIFFNPAGTDVVLLAEDADRKIDLRALEASYYRAILTDSDLAGHLPESLRTVAYAGACRAVTSTIPASRAYVLASIAATAIATASDAAAAYAGIWRIGPSGSVTNRTIGCEIPETRSLGDWTVALTPSVTEAMRNYRAQKLPAETGGVLLGILDVVSKRIDVVDAWPEPVDSKGSPFEFERGVDGLPAQVKMACAKTSYQVRYVGEWHSHPRRASVRPSQTDLKQIVWLTLNLGTEEAPAIMLIVGDDEVGIFLSTISNA